MSACTIIMINCYLSKIDIGWFLNMGTKFRLPKFGFTSNDYLE